jgi:phosphoglycolate phosphatase
MMRAVFLDLDGMLTDSGEGIVKSVDYALGKLDLPALSGDTNWIIGPPLWDSFSQLGVPEDELEHAVAFYRERYSKTGYLENRLYDGILQQLSDLRDAGYLMYLATAKPMSYAAKITAYFGISNYLTDQFGSEEDGTRSDKTSLLAHALSVAKSTPAQAIMIGDRHYDVVGAKANGIQALGAAYGYGGLTELRGAGADGLIETPHKLAATVREYLPK